MPDVAEATPPSGSLEEAGSRMLGLLSAEKKAGTEAPRESPPEQESKKEQAATPKQAPAAPESTSESEQATSATAEQTETESAQPPTPKIHKLKVDGEEIEVTEDELLKGYSRTADYTRKTQALAEKERKFEAETAAAVRAERQQYSELLGKLKHTIEAQGAEPDWDTLRTEATPEQFASEWTRWNENQKRLKQIEGEQARVKALQDEEADKGFKAYLAEQQASLERELPEIKDPVKGPKLRTELAAFGKSLGFSDQELDGVTDHRLVLVLHDAMQFRAQKAKAPEIANRIEQVLETTPPGSRTSTPRKSELAAAKDRLRQSGHVDDGASAIAALMRQEKAMQKTGT